MRKGTLQFAESLLIIGMRFHSKTFIKAFLNRTHSLALFSLRSCANSSGNQRTRPDYLRNSPVTFVDLEKLEGWTLRSLCSCSETSSCHTDLRCRNGISSSAF